MGHSAVPMPISRLAVVGAGPGGLAAAALARSLGRPDLQVRLLESDPRSVWQARRAFPLGLWAPACGVLRRLGVETSEPTCRAVPGGCYTNTAGRVLAEPSPSALRQGAGALRFFGSEAALLDAIAAAQGVAVDFGWRCTDVGPAGAARGLRLRCETPQGPEELEVDLAVFACGAGGGAGLAAGLAAGGHSPAVGAAPARPQRRGYTVYRGLSAAPLPPVFPTVAFQTWGPGVRFAAVPLASGSAWYATFEAGHALSRDPAAELDATARAEGGLDTVACVEKLRGALGHWHEPVDELLRETRRISVADAMASPFPWRASPRGRGRAVFLGDAAYTYDPILAVGAGEAISDAADLIDTLVARLQQPSSDAVGDRLGLGGIAHEGQLDGVWADLGRRRLAHARVLATLSNAAEVLGQTHWCSARDAAMNMAPGPLKRAVFDWSIRQLAEEAPPVAGHAPRTARSRS